MSRIANYPIAVPDKVDVTLGTGEVVVKGPLGSLTQKYNSDVEVRREGDQLVCKATSNSQQSDAMSGTLRALIANMVKGVTQGYEKKLSLVGVGFRAQAQGEKLTLQLGFSHPIIHMMPKGIKVETPVQTEIVVKGIDKQQVGQVAAVVRGYRPPEPYKGKGVRYTGERVKIKETKKK